MTLTKFYKICCAIGKTGKGIYMDKISLMEKFARIRLSIRSNQITLCVEKMCDNILTFSVYYRKTYLCVLAIAAHDSDAQINLTIEHINSIGTTIDSLIIQGKVNYETL